MNYRARPVRSIPSATVPVILIRSRLIPIPSERCRRATYEIGIGSDENGFGDYWNRAVNTMVVFDNKLYVSTGLNYQHGAQVWYSDNGET